MAGVVAGVSRRSDIRRFESSKDMTMTNSSLTSRLCFDTVAMVSLFPVRFLALKSWACL